MLKSAFEYKDKLEEVWLEASKQPDFLFFDEDERYVFKPDVNPEWKKEEWVSVNSADEVVGYLCAKVNKLTSCVDDISIANFKKDKTYAFDLVKFIRMLRRKYRVVRWAVVVGGPAEKHDDRIALLYGGRIVGTFKNKVRLADGKLYDEKWYEVEKGSKMKKVPPEFKT